MDEYNARVAAAKAAALAQQDADVAAANVQYDADVAAMNANVGDTANSYFTYVLIFGLFGMVLSGAVYYFIYKKIIAPVVSTYVSNGRTQKRR